MGILELCFALGEYKLDITLEWLTKHEATAASRVSKLTERNDPAWDVAFIDSLHCHPLASTICRVDRSVVDLPIIDPLKKKDN